MMNAWKRGKYVRVWWDEQVAGDYGWAYEAYEDGRCCGGGCLGMGETWERNDEISDRVLRQAARAAGGWRGQRDVTIEIDR